MFTIKNGREILARLRALGGKPPRARPRPGKHEHASFHLAPVIKAHANTGLRRRQQHKG